MGSDPEKAAEYDRTVDNLMVSTARKLSAELRVVVTRAVQAGLTQDEIDDHGPAGALDEGGSVFGLDLELDREMQMILEGSGMELGDGPGQPDTTEGELGLRSAIGLAGEYSPAGRTEMQLSSLDDTAGGLDKQTCNARHRPVLRKESRGRLGNGHIRSERSWLRRVEIH